MAGRQDIKAGRAYVELTTKDQGFKRGLAAAQKTLKATAVAGTAVATAIYSAAKRFADAGSEIADMAARTGLGTTALQEIKHAAEQTGGSIDDVEAGIRKMQKTLGDATAGSNSATEALGRVGLKLDDLKDLKPEDQFSKIAKQLRDITDPAQRSAAAMA